MDSFSVEFDRLISTLLFMVQNIKAPVSVADCVSVVLQAE